MTALPLRPDTSRTAIEIAIDAHGPGRVLLAALAALLRPRARPPDTAALPSHLRRDIGLPPHEPGLPSQRVDAALAIRGPFAGLR
ncbi:hypothetical protein [Jannaschia seohaensis]|uniref:Uncharacterized protein n=1 Tax=Jannaschia seohaensis TaxID=475081 RepID=A0A2Y9ADM4_9RHOB|nr:hypothetical protein [Jannaschia seohaensis]PWJ20938.1 hypothetical protein BCF38_102185 [Jannaschia seohaensis]SSA41348.1 hypothetical protein SAMN05421539_102185 [Jannaschia seohaensis]